MKLYIGHNLMYVEDSEEEPVVRWGDTNQIPDKDVLDELVKMGEINGLLRERSLARRARARILN